MRDISKAAFYVSYYQAGSKLNETERLEFYDTLLRYIFEGIEPEQMTFNVDLIFTTLKPFIDADLKRKSGGAAEGNDNAAKGETCRKCVHYYTCHRNGADFGLCENFILATKQPQNNHKTNNVNGNVNDNVNENGNGNNDVDFTELLLPKKTKDKINTCLLVGEFTTDFLNYCYKVVKQRYPDKPKKELGGLFTAAVFKWEDTRKNYNKLKKETAKTEKSKKPLPPKICTFCGASLIPGGMINTVECPSCQKSGVRTWWELEQNVWKCNR